MSSVSLELSQLLNVQRVIIELKEFYAAPLSAPGSTAHLFPRLDQSQPTPIPYHP